MRAILCADSKTCFRVSQLQCGNTGEDSAVLDQSVDCQKLPIVYFSNRSRRPRLSRSARFENQGRTCKSAAVCALAAFPSDDRVETHGNMSTAVLCRNFSGEASRPRCRQTREVRWQPTIPAGAGGEASEHWVRTGLRARRATERFRVWGVADGN